VSLDARNKKLMKGQADLTKVLNAINKYKDYFEIIKINVPIFVGENDLEIPDFVKYFNKIGITPRFIESMPTMQFKGKPQILFEDLIKKSLGEIKLESSYLWGINKYTSKHGKFETLRCICFDRKCDLCHKTNFLHVDQNCNIRPCNLQAYRICAERGKSLPILKKAINYLRKQKDVPKEYQDIWGLTRIPLRKLEKENNAK
jgi:molybdenum cofactor biosynthesis enzyme MoaA